MLRVRVSSNPVTPELLVFTFFAEFNCRSLVFHSFSPFSMGGALWHNDDKLNTSKHNKNRDFVVKEWRIIVIGAQADHLARCPKHHSSHISLSSRHDSRCRSTNPTEGARRVDSQCQQQHWWMDGYVYAEPLSGVV